MRYTLLGYSVRSIPSFAAAFRHAALVTCILLALPLCITAQDLQLSNVIATNVGSVAVTVRGADSRVWGQVVPWHTNASNQVVYRTNHAFTEIASGMNYHSGTNWVESSESIQVTAEGGAATNGQHKVTFAGNINTAGAVDLTLANGQRLRSHIVGVSYYDASAATNVLFALLKDSTGQIVGSNQVVYSSCFSNLQADVRLTYRRGGFEQDIILHEQPPPPSSWGLNTESVWLQVWTEFSEAPAPSITQTTESADQWIDFGPMLMGPGRAFVIGDESASVPVRKRWVTSQGRTYLLEEIQLSALAAQLGSLPPYSGGTNGQGGGQAMGYPGFPANMPPPPKLAQKGAGGLKLAAVAPAQTGLVLDYNLLTASTNFTFVADTTYYVSGSVTLSSNTTIEGGAVIKFTNSASAKITLSGPLISKTGPYRPAIFTSKDDNTVGETISGSSGNPSNTGATYLIGGAGQTSNYQFLRFSYAATAITNAGSATNWHSQFFKNGTAIDAGTNSITLRNVLIAQGTNGIKTTGPVVGEHVTADQLTNFNATNASAARLTNSILTGVINQPSWTTFTESVTYPNSNGIFSTAGGGHYYLANGSTNRNAGDTGVDVTLAADLKKLTTYPPTLQTNDFTSDTTLNLTATRDTDTPDRGYHYDPLDYLVSGLSVGDNVNPVTLTLSNASVGVSGAYGFNLQLNSRFVSQGTATALNRLTFSGGVQEQGAECSFLFQLTNDYGATAPPSLNLRFTDIARLGFVYNDNSGSPNRPFSWTMQDCSMFDQTFMAYPLSPEVMTIAWTNNVFARCAIGLGVYSGDNSDSLVMISMFNNLFRDGSLEMHYDEYGYYDGGSGVAYPTWVLANNAFDNIALSYSGHYYDSENWYGYIVAQNNGYVNTSALSDSSPVTISSFNYATGVLGPWYQSSTDFHDMGSTTADALGLYHYTTTTNQVKETNSPVDIGFHYVAVDLDGLPVDTNGNGIPDYLEDSNGNGVVDGGESPWTNAPPSVSISSPTNGATFNISGNTNLTLTATATDDGGISYVEFFRGPGSLGTTTSHVGSAWSLTWTNVAPGIYSLTAVAHDAKGLSTTSSVVSITVSGPCGYTYYTTNDFTNGILINLNWTNSSHMLQINQTARPLQYVNVSASSQDTLLRIDAKTTNGLGQTTNIVGEYRTTPQNKAGFPAHVAVDRYGNTWVANWDEMGNRDGTGLGSITRIGVVIGGTRGDVLGGVFTPSTNGALLKPPFDYCTAVDRDGDGYIRTSRGPGDVLAWTNSSATNVGSVNDAEDECIINYVRVPAQLASALVVDANNDVWVGGYCNTSTPDSTNSNVVGTKIHVKVDGVTGQVLSNTQVRFITNAIAYGGFSGAIDWNGALWSSGGANVDTGTNGNFSLVRYDSVNHVTNYFTTPTANTGHFGLAVDPKTGRVWGSSFTNDAIAVYNTNGTFLASYTNGSGSAAGIVIDQSSNIWVTREGGSTSIAHWRTDGTFIGNVSLTGVSGCSDASGASGISIDSNGKLWVSCFGSAHLVRIDPNGSADQCMPLPGYSGRASKGDMTGYALLAGTQPAGVWCFVRDSGTSNQAWNTLTWNTTNATSNQVRVEVRAANQRTWLTTNSFQAVQDSVQLTNVTGQFLEVRVTLLMPPGTTNSPSLHDLTIGCAGNYAPSISLVSPTNNQFFVLTPTNILLRATATDSDGTITNVAFYYGGTNLIGQTNAGVTNSFTFLWTNVQPGNYSLTAKAWDDASATTTSSSKSITVNDMPVIYMTNITNHLIGMGGTTNIALMAYANDTNGITNVEFICLTTGIGSLGVVTTPTNHVYGMMWNNRPVGTYPVYAKAKDSNGAVSVSDIVIFKVSATNLPPTVAITYPATNSASFRSGTTITITATATNQTGGALVTNVAFYVNGRLLANDTNAPYSVTECCWLPGSYELIAVATDSSGMRAVSDPVNITVSDESRTKGGGYWDAQFAWRGTTNGGPTASIWGSAWENHYGEIPELTTGNNGTELYLLAGVGIYHTTDGENWAFTNVNGGEFGIAVNGTKVYLAGDVLPTEGVKVWDGSTFSVVGTNTLTWTNTSSWGVPDEITAMAVVGSDLYVGGGFYAAGSNTNIQYIAKLNLTNNTWVQVGNGLNAPIYAMAEFNGELYIGGPFTNAGGNSNANYIAKLVGNTWTNVGAGVSSGTNAWGGTVTALAACGTNLFVGGYFATAGSDTNAHGIAIWNGATWRTMNGGAESQESSEIRDKTPAFRDLTPAYSPGSTAGSYPHVYALAVHDGRVFVGGQFGHVLNGTNLITANNIASAVWNENEQTWTWSDMDFGVGDPLTEGSLVMNLEVMENQVTSNADLYVSGVFSAVGTGRTAADWVARWIVGPTDGNAFKVSITSPTNNTVYPISPTNIAISATVVLGLTNVTSVNFFTNGDALPGTVISNSPTSFSLTWASAPAGTYALTAKATDANGLKVYSKPVPIIVQGAGAITNVSDVYTVIADTPGTNLFVLTNDVSGSKLRITSVSRVQGNAGTVEVSPDGAYLKYRPFPHQFGSDLVNYTATDGTNSSTAFVMVNVLARPLAKITIPTNGSAFATGTNVTVSGVTADLDGRVTNVALLVNGTPYGSPTTGTNLTNFSFSYSNSTASHYTFVTVATDNDGLTNASSPRTFALTNAATATNVLQAQLVNLPATNNAISPIYPIIRDGFLNLQGLARLNNSTNAATLSYQVMLYRPEDNPDVQFKNSFRNVTPGADPTGFRPGGDYSTNLGQLDLSGIANGTYDLLLTVRGGGGTATTFARFVLETDLKVGQFSFSEQDLAIPVAGIPLTVVRTYSSMNNRAADFGYGWTYALNSMDVQLDDERTEPLTVGGDNLPYSDDDLDDVKLPFSATIRTGGGRNVTLTMPDGKRATFRFTPQPYPNDDSGMKYKAVWTAPPGVHAKLETTSDIIIALPGLDTLWMDGSAAYNFENYDVRSWKLTMLDGTEFHITREAQTGVVVYDPAGNGEHIPVHPYGPPKLTKIVQRTGDWIEITNSVIRHFNATSNLTRSIYFERDNAGRITAIHDPISTNGLPVMRYVYNNQTSNLLQVLRLVDRTNGTYVTNKYRYDNPNLPHYITSIEDARGIPAARNEYDENGLLIAVTDANGNRVVMTHNTSGRLEVITDRLGKTNYFAYDTRGNVTETTNALNEVSRFAYDTDNNKTNEVVGYWTNGIGFVAMFTNSFGFDTNGLQTNMVDAMTHTNQFTYDSLGNLATQTDPLGNLVINSYSSDGLLTNTVQYDTNGIVVGQSTSIYVHGLLTQMRDANGNTNLTLGYDSVGNVTNTTDAKGFSHGSGYDSNGNQTNSTYVWIDSGVTNTVTTQTEYDAQGRMTHAVDANANNTWTYYNSVGKVDHTVDRFGNTNSFLYDGRGNIIQTTDALGLTNRTVYDENGRSILTTDRNGVTGTRTLYDDAGRVTNTIRVTGVVVALVTNGPGVYSTIVASGGTPYSTNQTTYFPTGWVKSRVSPDFKTNNYDYCADGQLKSVTDPLNHTTTYLYDEAGRQKAIGDALNHTNTFQCDALGRMVATIFHNGTYTSNTFNILGQRTAVRDQAGLTNQFGYDVAGNLTNVVKPTVYDPETNNTVAPAWSYTYDNYSRLTVTTDPKGRTNTVVYDALGREVKRGLPLGQVSSNVYNAKGQLSNQFDFKNQKTVFVYDNFGRVRAKFLFEAGNSSPSNAVCYQYNALGQLWKVVQRHGADANTNMCDGYMALVGPPVGSDVADAFLPALLRRLPPNTGAVALAFASIALAIALIPKEKRLLILKELREAWDAWDVQIRPNKRRFRLPSFGWKLATCASIAALFLADEKLNVFLNAQASCTYPANGSWDTTRITEFAYDNDGHLTQANTPEGVINYEYDAATGRQTNTCSANSQVAYGYDELGRLQTVRVLKRNAVVLTNIETTTYTYDAVGNRSTVTLPSGVVTTYVYDSLNRLTGMTNRMGSTNLSIYTYTLDATGRRTNVVEVLLQEGVAGYLTNTLSFAYDGMYRLTNELSSSSSSAGSYTNRYSYDKVGNRLKKTNISGANTDIVDSTFDSNDRLLSEVTNHNGSITGTNSYGYDSNGSMITRTNGATVTDYTYNLFNKLSSVVSGGATNTFCYNESGIRVRTTGATNKYFLVDQNNHTGYAQVLEEFNSLGGAPTASYVIGDDVLGECGTLTYSPTYMLYDGHGNTRQLANTSGGVTSRFNYDAYGQVLGTSTTTDLASANTKMLYCGEQYESLLGMYNLRARFYDPSNGRFNQWDSFLGHNEDPQSLHKYAYCHGDPINGLDPTGQFNLMELSVVIGIIAVLGALLLPGLGIQKQRATGTILRSAGKTDLQYEIERGHISTNVDFLGVDPLEQQWVIDMAKRDGNWHREFELTRANNQILTADIAQTVVTANDVFAGGLGLMGLIGEGEVAADIVYRVIRADETPALGLVAKNPAARYSVEGHILNGSRPGWASQYISTTRDAGVARAWAADSGNRIVAIDLNKVNGTIIDLSTEAGRNEFLRGVTAKNWAAASREVLIRGDVPANAILQ